MKIVITNDDGFGEPGIEALESTLQTLGEVVVVAPKRPHSFAGHRVTMKEDIPVEQVDSGKFVVDGTPADCTRLALKAFAPDADWVVAGINPGANLGTDVYQSGTVAAAREAAILRVRAIAISQYVSRGGAIEWEHTRSPSRSGLRLYARLKRRLRCGNRGDLSMSPPNGYWRRGRPIFTPMWVWKAVRTTA